MAGDWPADRGAIAAELGSGCEAPLGDVDRSAVVALISPLAAESATALALLDSPERGLLGRASLLGRDAGHQATAMWPMPQSTAVGESEALAI